MRFTRREFLVASASVAFSPIAAHGQQFPGRPIKIVYNYAPGGTGDTLARYVAKHMAEDLGQSVVVENRSGANGTIGTLAVARAPADGYTVLLSTITTIIQTPLETDAGDFDPIDGFPPIGNIASTPLVLLAHPSVPATDFVSLLKWAKTQPAGVDIAVSSPTLQVATALIRDRTKMNLVDIMYRGVAPSLTALLAGEVRLLINTPSGPIKEYLRQGKLKLIGVTSEKPSPVVPEGIPLNDSIPGGYVQEINFAMWAPLGTPSEVRGRLTDSLKKVMALPGMTEWLLQAGLANAWAGPDSVTRIARRENIDIRKFRQSTSGKSGG